MKKLVLALCFCLLFVQSASAHRPVRHAPPQKHHVTVVHHKRPLLHVGGSGFLLGSLAGIAAGSLIAESRYQNYSGDNEKCFILLSKSTGNITKKCLPGSEQAEVIYVD